jgi:rhamnosyltransferase
MATYNGEDYITDQINSIISQTYCNWKLYIRDDKSKDKTIEIIEKFAKNDSRIRIIRDDYQNVGQNSNFDLLMKECVNENGYFMFADQDDVWFTQKIELSLKRIESIEKSENFDTPILIYTNYYVSTSNLIKNKIAYKKKQNYSKNEVISRIFVQNWIMGCTVLINKSLLNLSINIPTEAKNHDNWIAILASLNGKIDYISEPTMKHRIHSNNVTTNKTTTSFISRLVRLNKRFKNNNESFINRLYLLTHVEKRLINKNKENLFILFKYKEMLQSRGLKALNIACRTKFYGVNRIQTLLFFAQLIFKNEVII